MNNAEAILDSDTQLSASANDSVTSSADLHPMALLLDEIEQSLLELQVGDIRNGIIVDKRPNELLVDIGFKSEGLVTGREMDRIREIMDTIEVGSEIPVFIMREDKDGVVQLSISRALAEGDWQRAEELMESQDIFEGEVTAHNRGGVIIKVGQVRGFVPASQLAMENHPNPGNDSNSSEDSRWIHLIGKILKLKVIDIDRKRNRLILSERLAVREWRRKQKEELLANLKEGDIYDGIISSIADFGAFVNLGGADGLIHLSELSWNRIRHPSEVVSVGDEIKVQILNVDQERKRIGLSYRRLQPQPWDMIDDLYEVGQIVTGKITKLVNFGAFARLDDSGIEGLIHISELSDNRVGHAKEVVNEGDEYDLRIIRIDIDKRRMGLSLKQALPPAEEVELDWQIAPSEDDEEEGSPSELVAQAIGAMGLSNDADDDDEDDGNSEDNFEILESETIEIDSDDEVSVIEVTE